MDRDRSTNGGWRCKVNRRERQRRYWHQADGGYVLRRRRHLHGQRQHVLEQLGQLEREAKTCAES